MKFRFLTSTPLDISRGSGTYVGISVLAAALRGLGHTVDFESSTRHFPVYTLERLWFNRRVRPSANHDFTIGFDMDGYRIANSPGHIVPKGRYRGRGSFRERVHAPHHVPAIPL